MSNMPDPLQTRDHADGGVRVITLSRADALNALNGPLLDALDAALDDIERENNIRALVIAGQGKAFCAGADLKETDIDPIARCERMHRFVLRLLAFPKISVAAINGLALGGGLELAMACTLRVASADARLGLPEIKLDMMPGYGGTQLLPRLVSSALALEMLLSGDAIDTDRASAAGLVNAVAQTPEETMVAAINLAQRCSRQSPVAQQSIRHAVSRGMLLPLDEALAFERELVAKVHETDAAQSALAAFRSRGRASP